MNLEFTAPDGKTMEVTESNYRDFYKNFQSSLKPGIPVYVKKESFRSGFSSSSQGMIFTSNGKIFEDGGFGIEQGKFSSPVLYVPDESLFNKKGQDLLLVHNLSENLNSNKGALPFINSPRSLIPYTSQILSHYNEHSFSPAGPSVTHHIKGSGITKIIMGEEVEKRYPNATRLIDFGQNSMYMELPSNRINRSDSLRGSRLTLNQEFKNKTPLVSKEELIFLETLLQKEKVAKLLENAFKIAASNNKWKFGGSGGCTIHYFKDLEFMKENFWSYPDLRSGKEFGIEGSSPSDIFYDIDGRIDGDNYKKHKESGVKFKSWKKNLRPAIALIKSEEVARNGGFFIRPLQDRYAIKTIKTAIQLNELEKKLEEEKQKKLEERIKNSL